MTHSKTVLLIILLFISMLLNAQYGTLKGKVTEYDNKTPNPIASVIIESGGMHLWETSCDTNGNYTIKAIPPGKYLVIVKAVCYHTVHVIDVIIKPDRITFLNINTRATMYFGEIFVKKYIIPLFEKDATISGETIFMK